MRKELAIHIGPETGIQFRNIRKTKKEGFALAIVQDNTDEEYIVRIKKGGKFRPGTANEIGLQGFIQSEIDKNGVCHLDITDNYGVNVQLDIAEVINASSDHGKGGKANRSDTTVKLKDGSLYGISQKQPDASLVCGAKKLFKKIIFQCESIIRKYAKEHGMKRGDYIDIRVTNRDLIKLCWFGTDFARGAVFMGDFREMESGTMTIERIIEDDNEDFMTSFPIYAKWLIYNS